MSASGCSEELVWSEKRDGGGWKASLVVLSQTLIHIPFTQLLALIRHRLKKQRSRLFPSYEARRIRKIFLHDWPLARRRANQPEIFISPLNPERLACLLAAWRDLQNGKITVLNRVETFPPGSFWSLFEQRILPPLVIETLHYHQVLADCAELLHADAWPNDTEEFPDRQGVLDAIQEIIRSWREKFPVGSNAGWTAFAAAWRVGSWLKIDQILSMWPLKNSDNLRGMLAVALFEQGLFIERNLESHLGGNHLLNNLCGLAQLAGYFEGPASERWMKILRRDLPVQLKKQILPDGGHYELSPMYHCLVMSDLLSAAESLRTVDAGWVEEHLHEPVQRMGGFLAAVLHDDGDIPFFNDAVLGQAPSPMDLFQRLERLAGSEIDPAGEKAATPNVLTHSGFVRLKARGLTAIIDQGRLGPDELMGHVHSDALSFEVSFKHQRVLVNRGVYEYTSGPRRNEARSIRSHNTPCVDDCEQAEIWSSFRVGQRRHLDEHFFIETGDGWRAGGGWRTPGGVSIQRSIILTGQGRLEVWDSIKGEGSHRISIPFHWGPSLEVRLCSQSPFTQGLGACREWESHGQDVKFYGKTYSHPPGELLAEPTTWWPGFYREERIERLKFHQKSAALPVLVWTVFSPFPELLAETDEIWKDQAHKLLNDPALMRK